MTIEANAGPAHFKIRHKLNLPRGQENVISVARYNAGWYGLLLLALAIAAFFGGVVAGTSGWYRESANALADSTGLPGDLRSAILLPDRAAAASPNTAEAIAALVQRLEAIEAEQSAALAEREELLSDYVTATASISALRDTMLKAATDSSSARSSVEELRSAIDAAHRARLGQADRPPDAPPTEPNNADP